MGERLARLLVYPIAAYFFITDGKGRRASLEYLRQLDASPGGREALGAIPGPRLVYHHFLECSFSVLDRLAFWIGEPGDIPICFHGEERLAELALENRGAILLGGHVGCFDAMRVLASRSPKPIHVLMYTEHASRINSVLREISGEVDLRVISMEPGSIHHIFELKKCIDRGEFVAILGDRIAPGEADRVVHVPFLGRMAAFPQGPTLLAATLGCPVLLVSGIRLENGSYEVAAEPYISHLDLPRVGKEAVIAKKVEDYARWLEGRCLRVPFQWFNFFDFWEMEQ